MLHDSLVPSPSASSTGRFPRRCSAGTVSPPGRTRTGRGVVRKALSRFSASPANEGSSGPWVTTGRSCPPVGSCRPHPEEATLKTLNNVTRAAAVAALALSSLAVPASATGSTGPVRAEIDCPSGYVCIYPEINFGGQPWYDAPWTAA